MSFRQVRSALSEEFAAIRSREPDRDAGHITVFGIPLLLGLVGVLAIGVVPLIVVRSGDETDSVLVPLVGSFALTAICTAVVAWLTANVLSGVIVMVLYRTSPRMASRLVVRTMVDSFYRIEGRHRAYRVARRCGGVVVGGVRIAKPAGRGPCEQRARRSAHRP